MTIVKTTNRLNLWSIYHGIEHVGFIGLNVYYGGWNVTRLDNGKQVFWGNSLDWAKQVVMEDSHTQGLLI